MSSLNKDSLRIFLSLNAFFFSFLFFSYFFFLFFFCGLITLAKMSIILLNISGKVDIFASFLVLMRKHIEINSLSVAWFAIIFSHSEGCLFTLLIVSFVVQKLLILIRSHSLFLLLFPIFWEVSHRGSCCDLCRRVFCLCSPLGVL